MLPLGCTRGCPPGPPVRGGDLDGVRGLCFAAFCSLRLSGWASAARGFSSFRFAFWSSAGPPGISTMTLSPSRKIGKKLPSSSVIHCPSEAPVNASPQGYMFRGQHSALSSKSFDLRSNSPLQS
jgi:hypothetical protein